MYDVAIIGGGVCVVGCSWPLQVIKKSGRAAPIVFSPCSAISPVLSNVPGSLAGRTHRSVLLRGKRVGAKANSEGHHMRPSSRVVTRVPESIQGRFGFCHPVFKGFRGWGCAVLFRGLYGTFEVTGRAKRLGPAHESPVRNQRIVFRPSLSTLCVFIRISENLGLCVVDVVGGGIR